LGFTSFNATYHWAPKKKVKERAAEMEAARAIGSFMDDAEVKESV
jgi:hypothetical protein